MPTALADIEINDAAQVQSYLDRHPDIVSVTESICMAARRYFGEEAHLALQVYRDAEIDDAYLLLRVRLRSYAPDTLQRIRAITDPYEQELCDKSGSILVTTDFGSIP